MVSDRDSDRASSQQPPGSVSPNAGAIAMTSVIDITRLFAEAHDNHTKFAGTPNDDHVVALKKDLLNVCLQIASKGTDAGDPSGAILKDTCYQVVIANNMPYNRQVAACAKYDPDLQADNPAFRAEE